MPSDEAAISSPGIACFSVIQAPRSMSLQRSLQNGRNGEASDHSTGRWQVGQLTTVAMACTARTAYVHVASVKRTSSAVCTGRLPASCQTRKRMLQR